MSRRPRPMISNWERKRKEAQKSATDDAFANMFSGMGLDTTLDNMFGNLNISKPSLDKKTDFDSQFDEFFKKALAEEGDATVSGYKSIKERPRRKMPRPVAEDYDVNPYYSSKERADLDDIKLSNMFNKLNTFDNVDDMDISDDHDRNKYRKLYGGSKRGCVEQKTKKYTSRNSPPYPANECPPGTKIKGNDKKWYVAIPNVNGINTWKKLDTVAKTNVKAMKKDIKRAEKRAEKTSKKKEIVDESECDIVPKDKRFSAKSRKAPPYNAANCAVGTIKQGKDGWYVVTKYAGGKRWKKVDKKEEKRAEIGQSTGTTGRGCVRQKTKKYINRNSPPYPANECPAGMLKKGNNGDIYVAWPDKNGVNRWYPYTKKVKAKLEELMEEQKKPLVKKRVSFRSTEESNKHSDTVCIGNKCYKIKDNDFTFITDTRFYNYRLGSSKIIDEENEKPFKKADLETPILIGYGKVHILIPSDMINRSFVLNLQDQNGVITYMQFFTALYKFSKKVDIDKYFGDHVFFEGLAKTNKNAFVIQFGS